ncbi:helix-turn-helix domain-containing protein [Dyadobacter chenwenxiniae]|uniref:Helix-turn-helix domain-containing protein n=1 Tax=Dyadobacter chenwenxiniae TaxID=2906456 RepID=A0A9X1PHF6_9BACT|nr:helix-turn-helix domain-containing protein [Dyadobacter chenwenxiniae]MCF0061140.1 helix-turn-helix domain-containing protein [Dyadobacter chenwenxiniae]UON80967.1 helix-turn-helix domain-containing protein [Dyadobacter chenwenxiniae]
MAQIKRSHTLKETDIKSLIQKGEISSELELERASLAARFLRLQSENQPELALLEERLSTLIRDYELKHWSDFKQVTEKQVAESDLAEKRAEKEFKFYKKRRELISKTLKQNGLNQNDLAAILAHNKSYISELLNGIRTFSMNDLIIIHRLFGIKLEDLVFTEITVETEKRIKEALEKTVSNSSKTKKPAQVTSLVKALYS